VLSRAFVTICISPLTVDNVQSDKAGDQYGHLELPGDDSFESGKPTSRPGKRKNISISMPSSMPDSTTCLSSDQFAFVGKLSNCQIQFDSIESLHG
jgi:hypothetical protein